MRKVSAEDKIALFFLSISDVFKFILLAIIVIFVIVCCIVCPPIFVHIWLNDPDETALRIAKDRNPNYGSKGLKIASKVIKEKILLSAWGCYVTVLVFGYLVYRNFYV